eukprot:1083363-Amphidinium_carterae.2
MLDCLQSKALPRPLMHPYSRGFASRPRSNFEVRPRKVCMGTTLVRGQEGGNHEHVVAKAMMQRQRHTLKIEEDDHSVQAYCLHVNCMPVQLSCPHVVRLGAEPGNTVATTHALPWVLSPKHSI